MIDFCLDIYKTVAKFWNLENQLNFLKLSSNNNKLYKMIKSFPKKKQDYIAWRAYHFALLGYGIEIILNELQFLKRIIK